MKTFLIVSVIAVVTSAPAVLRAQSAKPQPSAALGKKTVAAKSAPRSVLFRHPNAAQRHLTSADLVAVTTPSGEKRYARKKAVKPTR